MSLVLKRPRNVAHRDQEIGRTPSEFEGVHVKMFICFFFKFRLFLSFWSVDFLKGTNGHPFYDYLIRILDRSGCRAI